MRNTIIIIIIIIIINIIITITVSKLRGIINNENKFYNNCFRWNCTLFNMICFSYKGNVEFRSEFKKNRWVVYLHRLRAAGSVVFYKLT